MTAMAIRHLHVISRNDELYKAASVAYTKSPAFDLVYFAMTNFWSRLQKPFLALAPMDDVTDVVFREVITQHLPRPDIFFTEFASVDGLCSRGAEQVKRKIRLTEHQHPVVAQIWGTNPEHFFTAAQMVQELGFDGVDINMGCPVDAVIKKGAGAALCRTPELAKDIIAAVKGGAPNLPVSVKTRLGLKKMMTEEWVTVLLQQDLAALTIHGRTAAELSKVPANWEEIGKAVAIRDAIAPQTMLVGNGDIESYAQAIDMHKKFGVDGVMIGRGIFANPWVFEKTLNPTKHTKDEYLALLKQHLELFDKTWGKTKNFEMLKKFFKMYVKGFDGANELRQKLMLCKTAEQIYSVFKTA
jgi:nifR3 family TIM-barrel protein